MAAAVMPLVSHVGNVYLGQQQQQQHPQRLPTSHCDPSRRDAATSVGRSRVSCRRTMAAQGGNGCAVGTGSNGGTGSGSGSGSGHGQSQWGSSARSQSFAAPPHAMSIAEFQRTVAAMAAANGGALHEDAVRGALACVAPDAAPLLLDRLRAATSLPAFLASISELSRKRQRAYTGFETTLQEFQELVAARLAASPTAEADIAAAMRLLGPECHRVVSDAWDGRTSLADFLQTLPTLRRRISGAAFTATELSTVMGNLIDAEARLKVVSPETVQPTVTPRMRGILVDWMVEVTERFKCAPETLHLASSLVDRYLMVQPLSRAELQLVGVAAMLIATKYEEVCPPELKQFVFIAASTYPAEDIVRMERHLFQSLEFRITVPTSNALAQGILFAQDPTPTRLQLCVVGYVLDTLLIAFFYGHYPPSVLAAAAVLYSRLWVGIPTAPEHISADVAMLVPVITAHLRDVNAPNGRLQAIRTKYGAAGYEWVSSLTIPNALVAFAQGGVPSMNVG